MKKEYFMLIYSMINNLIIAAIKLVSGFVFGLSSLFADGLHTISDFVINIISFIGIKLSHKKPTKHHPYGFGRVEYLTNQLIGILLLLLGIYIIVHAFSKQPIIPPIPLIWVLIIVIALKGIAIIMMVKKAKKYKSKALLTTAQESMADVYSTLGVAIILIVLQFSVIIPELKYIDLIGTILIGVFVAKIALGIIIENSLALVGEVEEDEEVVNKLKMFLLKYHKDVKEEDIYLIKYGSYYKLQLNIELDPSMRLTKITRLENKIKKDIIRHYSLGIKYVSIFVTYDLHSKKDKKKNLKIT